MDIQTSLICIFLAILSGVVLFFIYSFGMQKKTFEEAIAEQRKMPSDALLLGTPNKGKSKSKKPKRLGKKVKEKPGSTKVIANKKLLKKIKAPERSTKIEPKVQDHGHVIFLSPEAKILSENDCHTHLGEKKTKLKKEKIKPILVHKKEPKLIKEKPVPKELSINHFTVIHPKDDLELKLETVHKHVNNIPHQDQDNGKFILDKDLKSKEKTASKSMSKENNKNAIEKSIKSEIKSVNKYDKLINQSNQQTSKQNYQLHQSEVKIKSELNGSVSNSSVEQSPVQVRKMNNQQILNNKDTRNKKHKKNELFSLNQMTEKDVINIHLLLPLIQKAELSRNEVQVLTDLLLTKHLDEVSDRFEWTEGRQDPVVKLKKQLAEKEKALTEEQEVSQAFQNKLKELRSEFNSERARLAQACRQYDETISAKQNEIQNLHSTNRHLIDSHVAEKQALSQKIQQLQGQVNDDNMVIRKLQEDHGQAQNALQQELVNQSQQMEIHISRLNEQHQEAQKNFEAQIHNKIQETEQLKASFNAELQKNRSYENEMRELREQLAQSQNKIQTLESRASQLKESSSHTQELARQIEDLQRSNKELEKLLSNSHQAEESLKFENNTLQNELHGFTIKLTEVQNECDQLIKEKEKWALQIAAKNDIEKDLMRIKEENQCLNSQVSSFSKMEREAQQLREENETLAAQLTAFNERSSGKGRENGDNTIIEVKKSINVEFINHENQKDSKDAVIEQLSIELKEKDLLVYKLNTNLQGHLSEISKLSAEVSNYKTEVSNLKESLEMQRNKNNDLRQKNWKAMEALAATEKSLEGYQKQIEKYTKEQKFDNTANKKLLQRIFPNIEIKAESVEQWLSEFEKSATSYLKEMKLVYQTNEDLEVKNTQYQNSIERYKTIIGDTEEMLNKLQNHVEQEEIRWRHESEALESQVQTLKEELTLSENEKEKLESTLNQLKKSSGDIDSIRKECVELRHLLEVENEKTKNLSDEIKALNIISEKEKEKNEELSNEIVRLKSTAKFREDAFIEEHKRRIESEEQVKLLKSDKIIEAPINSSGDFVAYEAGGFDKK